MGCRHATDASEPSSALACSLQSSASGNDSEPPKPPPSRAELISSIFHSCDADEDDHLSCLELMRFASLVDYLDGQHTWTQKYDWMCDRFGWVPEVGADISAFTRLVDNDDAAGYFRTTSELRRLLRELLELSKLEASDDSDEESSSSCSSGVHRSTPTRATKRRKTKQKKRMMAGALSKMQQNPAYDVVERLIYHGMGTLLQEDDDISALQCAVEASELVEGVHSELQRLISEFGIRRSLMFSQLPPNDSDSEGNEEATAKPGIRRKPRKVSHHEGSQPKKAAVKRRLPGKTGSAAFMMSQGETSPRGMDRENSREDRVFCRASKSDHSPNAASEYGNQVLVDEIPVSFPQRSVSETSIGRAQIGALATTHCAGDQLAVPQGDTSIAVGRLRAETDDSQLLEHDPEDEDAEALDLRAAVSLPANADMCLRSKKPLLRRGHHSRMRGLFKRKILKPGKQDVVNEQDEVLEQMAASLSVASCSLEDLEGASDHSNEGLEAPKTAKAKSKRPSRTSKTVQVAKPRRTRLLGSVP